MEIPAAGKNGVHAPFGVAASRLPPRPQIFIDRPLEFVRAEKPIVHFIMIDLPPVWWTCSQANALFSSNAIGPR